MQPVSILWALILRLCHGLSVIEHAKYSVIKILAQSLLLLKDFSYNSSEGGDVSVHQTYHVDTNERTAAELDL